MLRRLVFCNSHLHTVQGKRSLNKFEQIDVFGTKSHFPFYVRIHNIDGLLYFNQVSKTEQIKNFS